MRSSVGKSGIRGIGGSVQVRVRVSGAIPRLSEAFALYQKGSLSGAESVCRQVIRTNPGDAEALHLLSIIEAQNNDLLAALKLIDRAIALSPENFRFHMNRSLVLQRLSRRDEALASCEAALAIKAEYPRALNSRGVILRELNRLGEALESYDRALALKPDFADAHNNRGVVLHDLGRHDAALASYDLAVSIKPDYADAFINRGILLQERGQLTESLSSYDSAIAINPDCVDAHNNRGFVLQRMNRFRDALDSFDCAIRLKPDCAETLNNRGFILHRLGRFQDAIASYESALALAPDFIDALNNIGVSFHMVNRFEEALLSYDRALAIKPDYAEALCNRGQVLLVQGETDAAIGCLKRATEITHNPAVHSALIFGLNFDPSASASAKQAERRKWATRYAEGLANSISYDNDHDPNRQIRVGYVSNYFYRCASAYAFGGVITNHNDGFYVICYSDSTISDDVTASMRNRAEQWHDTAGLSDHQLADLIRRDRIDILVDLVGHMAGNRLIVFGRKPAPVQVTAWGEPTGTGLRAMDYLLADNTLVPECEGPLLSEQVVRLPNFLGYWAPDPIPAPAPLPSRRKGHMTFGSCNRLEKLSPATITSWAAILRNLPTAHLILKDKALENANQRARLQRVFIGNGVSPDRVTFLAESERATHFAAYSEIDIALDPFPHSGGMTTLDALWMGVPVVTCPGQTIASRLAAASLAALGLNHFICRDLNQYIGIAVGMATDLEWLSDLRSKLRALLAESGFGDPVRYSRAVESAYRDMWRNWCTARM
jgi:protein O-GlcNAc transferase